ncbi:MAG: Orotate phosphoribosyltransferase, partial [Pseudomonadota bacterium]
IILNMTSHSSEFIQFALESKVLSFGSFKTKAGRISPYFFNAGDFNDGDRLRALGQFYARALVHAGISFEMLFGPAYKGITLAATTAIALAQMGQSVPFSYNRKEVKDHGEGGIIVGAPLKGRGRWSDALCCFDCPRSDGEIWGRCSNWEILCCAGCSKRVWYSSFSDCKLAGFIGFFTSQFRPVITNISTGGRGIWRKVWSILNFW